MPRVVFTEPICTSHEVTRAFLLSEHHEWHIVKKYLNTNCVLRLYHTLIHFYRWVFFSLMCCWLNWVNGRRLLMENYYLFHFLRQKKLNLNSLFCSDITTTLNAIWQKIVCPWKSAELTFFVRRWTYLTGDGNSNFPIEREERHVCVQQLYKTPLTLSLQWDNNYLFWIQTKCENNQVTTKTTSISLAWQQN